MGAFVGRRTADGIGGGDGDGGGCRDEGGSTGGRVGGKVRGTNTTGAGSKASRGGMLSLFVGRVGG